jgi:hypothetical protein
MVKKQVIWMFVILCIVSFASAQVLQTFGTFKQNSCIDLIQVCSNCTYNNITSVNYPNSTIAEANLTMAKDGTVYRRTYCNTSIIGVYTVYGVGDLDGIITTWGYDFKITKYGIGEENTDSALPLMLFMLFIIIGLFIGGFYGKFNPHEIVNLCLRRGCIVAAIMISMYTTTLLMNVMAYANMDLLGNEMIFLMTWIGWAGYIASVYLVIQSLFDILNLRKKMRKDRDERIDY